MEKSQWFIIGVAILLLLTFAIYFGNEFNVIYREIQDTKEEIKVKVVDELKTIYDTDGVRILDEIKNNNEYTRYEILVGDVIKQVIYLKDTSEIKIID